MTKKKPTKRPDVPFAAPDWPATSVEMRALAKIIPYPQNPRTHPPAQITLLAKLMKQHGVDQPIVLDELGVILKGHGRRLAAVEAGFEEFPVVIHRGLSDADKTAMRLQDNQLALLSGWDRELIRGEITSLKLAGYDIPLLGFSDAQLSQYTIPVAAPGSFPAFGEDIETEHKCPRCGYAWSGKAAATVKPEPPAPKKKTNGRAKR